MELINKIINIDSDIYKNIYGDNRFIEKDCNIDSELIHLYIYLIELGRYKGIDNYTLLKYSLEENFYETMKILFYIRDVKEGLGRRKVFRDAIKFISEIYPEELSSYIKLIPIYGRWDDLYSLFDTKNEEIAAEIFKEQIEEDLKSIYPSSLGKWLKSINASSKESRRLAKKTCEWLSLSYKDYRKLLKKLRSRIGVVEHKITTKELHNIKYGELSNLSFIKYNKLFIKKDFYRINRYLNFNNYNNEEVYISDYMEIIRRLVINYDNNLIGNEYNEELNYFLNMTLDKIKSESNNWLVFSVIREENFKLRNSYFFECIRYIIYYMFKNKGIFKNYMLKPNSNVSLTKLKSAEFNNIVSSLLNTLDSMTDLDDKVYIDEVLDNILLSAVKNNLKDTDIPVGIVFVTYDLYKVIDKNICSDMEKIALWYKELKEKWNKFNYTLPEIKILIHTNINEFEVREINKYFKIIYGAGDKVFRYIIKDKVRTKIYDYNKLVYNLESILKSKRYLFK